MVLIFRHVDRSTCDLSITGFGDSRRRRALNKCRRQKGGKKSKGKRKLLEKINRKRVKGQKGPFFGGFC